MTCFGTYGCIAECGICKVKRSCMYETRLTSKFQKKHCKLCGVEVFGKAKYCELCKYEKHKENVKKYQQKGGNSDGSTDN